jgi:hypothetical protein
MSTPPRARYTVSPLVLAYLAVVGIGLIAWCFWLLLGFSDEQFPAGLALGGGVTMLVTVAALATIGRRA